MKYLFHYVLRYLFEIKKISSTKQSGCPYRTYENTLCVTKNYVFREIGGETSKTLTAVEFKRVMAINLSG